MSTDDNDDVRAEHFCLQMSFAVVVFVAFTFSFRSVVWSAHRFAIIKSTNAFEYLLFECHSIFPTASNWKFQLNYQNFYFLIISKWQSKSLSDCEVKKRTRFKIICGFCKYDLFKWFHWKSVVGLVQSQWTWYRDMGRACIGKLLNAQNQVGKTWNNAIKSLFHWEEMWEITEKS